MTKTYFVMFIDLGTDGVTVGFVNLKTLKIVVAVSGAYKDVAGLNDGQSEQRFDDWWKATVAAAKKAKAKLLRKHQGATVIGICMSGQMHGLVGRTGEFEFLPTTRIWRDNRGVGQLLTKEAGGTVKVANRMTVSKWGAFVEDSADQAAKLTGVTTPAGAVGNYMTGNWDVLGFGECSGICPLVGDAPDLSYNMSVIEAADALRKSRGESLLNLLPKPQPAGTEVGKLRAAVAKELDLDSGTPVFAFEGDQQAAIVGSLVVLLKWLAWSFGTSCTGNLLSDKEFPEIHPAVDGFRTADGKLMWMVCANNGSGFYNMLVALLVASGRFDRFGTPEKRVKEARKFLDKLALKVPAGCNGLSSLPFYSGVEQVAGFEQKAISALIGLVADNCDWGSLARVAFEDAALLVNFGLGALAQHGIGVDGIVLTGGPTEAPGDLVANIVAAATGKPVTIRATAGEGSGFGAALLGAYGVKRQETSGLSLAEFLKTVPRGNERVIDPDTAAAKVLAAKGQRLSGLITNVEPALLELFRN